MRNATIDGRQVRCPNTSLLGFGRAVARVGDFLTFDAARYPSTAGVGRMIGRVAFAPPCGDAPPVRNRILALCLSRDAGALYLRWIAPEEVRYVSDVPTDLAAFFFAPKLPYDRETLLKLADHGTLQDQFVTNAADRVAMFTARGTL